MHGQPSVAEHQAAPRPGHRIRCGVRPQPLQQHGVDRCKTARPGRCAGEPLHELVVQRAADRREVNNPRSQLAAAHAQQCTRRTRFQEHVQRIQISAHTHQCRGLLQAGDEGLEPAGRLCARHARDLDRPRQADDQIDVAGGQAGVLPRREIAHAAAGVVRDPRAELWRGRADGKIRGGHRGIVANSKGWTITRLTEPTM